MKYKTQILTKIDSIENALDFIVRNLSSHTISAEETVTTLKNQLKQLQSVKDLTEAEF
jgi:hypothetical protein